MSASISLVRVQKYDRLVSFPRRVARGVYERELFHGPRGEGDGAGQGARVEVFEVVRRRARVGAWSGRFEGHGVVDRDRLRRSPVQLQLDHHLVALPAVDIDHADRGMVASLSTNRPSSLGRRPSMVA